MRTLTNSPRSDPSYHDGRSDHVARALLLGICASPARLGTDYGEGARDNREDAYDGHISIGCGCQDRKCNAQAEGDEPSPH